MFRVFLLICSLLIFVLNFAVSNSYATVANLNFEVTQVISEAKQAASLIKKAGGTKDAECLLERARIVEQDFQAGQKEKLLISLQSLRAEVLRRHAYLNIALAHLVGKENTKTEIKALQFINRVEYLLKSIEKRINKIRGDR